jgi:hypothetical protein
MQRDSSSSKAYLLLDYVQRLERHREDRRAVHIHLSQLKAQNRREHHLRIAENTFDDLTKQFDGQVFGMQNGDIVYIGREITLADMDDAVQRLRVLFGEDPLAQSIDAGTEDLFCTYYNVDTQYTTLLEVAERLYNEEQRRIKRLQMAAEQSGDALNSEQSPLTPQQLGKLIEFLGRADLSSVMRRQSICAVAGTDLPRPVFKELFISIGELAQQVLPDVNLAANRWLFQHLTETLDLRVLKLLTQADDRDLHSSFSVNLNVSTLLSREFNEFDTSLRTGGRGTIVLELQLIDIYSDVANYMFARDFVRERGYRICVDGVTHQSLPLIDRQALGADLIKLAWLPELSDGVSDDTRAALAKQVEKAGSSRVILTRCDAPAAIRLGQSMGVSMYQGRYLDTVLQNQARRRNERSPSRQFQAIEDAAEQEEAEEKAEEAS